MSTNERRATRLLAAGSWVMLALFGLLFIGALIPPFGNAMSTKTGTFNSWLGALSGLCIAFAFLSVWIGAVWHAVVHGGFVSEGHRVTVIVILVVGNVLAGLCYYFGYVRWLPQHSSEEAAA